MTDAPAAFQATFCDWRLIKGRKVVQIVLEVPLELSDAAYKALGGMPDPAESVWCAVARLRSAEEEVKTEPTSELPARSPRQVSPEKRLAQQAGIACADLMFQHYLVEEGMISEPNETLASIAVRQFCEVESRREIVLGTPAADKWDQLHGRFLTWKLAA